MTKRQPRTPFRSVSDAELVLLKELWDEGPATPAELHERLGERGEKRAYTTVQTLLHRLFEKGWVTRAAEGQARRYTAKGSREDMLAGHLGDLAERVCDGMSSPLVQTLVRGGGLAQNEIDELRDLLDQAESKAKKGKPKRRGR